MGPKMPMSVSSGFFVAAALRLLFAACKMRDAEQSILY
jgi:hypothetical protein